jgi:hypothetical protein
VRANVSDDSVTPFRELRVVSATDLLTSVWLSVAIALVGGAVAGFLVARYFWGRPERVLLATVWNATLVAKLDSKVPGLSVWYGDVAVPTVSVARVVFWNAGKKAIQRSHFAAGDLFRVEIAGGRTVLAASNNPGGAPGNRIEATWDQRTRPNAVLVRFEYLNRGEGGAIQILHTGESTGEIKVAGSFIDTIGPNVVEDQPSARRVFASLLAVVLTILVGAAVSNLALPAPWDSLGFWIILLALIGFLSLIPYLRVAVGSRASPVPRHLQEFVRGESFQPELATLPHWGPPK